ncbi:MAG: hypothetical protein Q4C48_04575 [Lachnospiraceae bacterium]|nr:hypothetical protein [Lachnospiraceae bacterium]
MSNIFQDILEKLKQSEKQTLIRSSGSTRGSGNEKIRSGQSYLYKLRGMESEVIEIRFKKKIRGSFLTQALSETMKRYPYFNTKLIEKDGDFYIVQNDISLQVRKTKQLAKLGGIECGYHLIDVTYNDRSVFVSFHHALCDGRGIKPFIETLIWYYCRFAYGNEIRVDGIRYADEELLDGETADPFLGTYEYDDKKQFISLSRDAYALPENTTTNETINYRYEVTVSQKDFMATCKRNNATPVILLSIFMSKAITEIFPDYDKPINANIATDMREALGYPNTFKNCVKSMILPYDREFSALPLEEQGKKYREILNAQRDYDYCRHEANAMIGLFDRLDTLDSYDEKRKIMAFFEGMQLNTYIVSYLGQFNLGDNKTYLDGIHLYNSGTTGLGINMISCGEKFLLDFKQNFRSDRYVKSFLKQLDEFQIAYDVSEVIEFFTPTDKLLKRHDEGGQNS